MHRQAIAKSLGCDATCRTDALRRDGGAAAISLCNRGILRGRVLEDQVGQEAAHARPQGPQVSRQSLRLQGDEDRLRREKAKEKAIFSITSELQIATSKLRLRSDAFSQNLVSSCASASGRRGHRVRHRRRNAAAAPPESHPSGPQHEGDSGTRLRRSSGTESLRRRRCSCHGRALELSSRPGTQMLFQYFCGSLEKGARMTTDELAYLLHVCRALDVKKSAGQEAVKSMLKGLGGDATGISFPQFLGALLIHLSTLRSADPMDDSLRSNFARQITLGICDKFIRQNLDPVCTLGRGGAGALCSTGHLRSDFAGPESPTRTEAGEVHSGKLASFRRDFQSVRGSDRWAGLCLAWERSGHLTYRATCRRLPGSAEPDRSSGYSTDSQQ
eukprot:scaffold8403_cov420-Pinguiococcus_pyrenoidosus.AAC.1